MKIGQVSTLVGLPASTLRFYERTGVLRPLASRRGPNNYRDYSEADVANLKLVLALREAGLPLNKIGELTSDQARDCGLLRVAAERQLSVLETTIRNLSAQRDALRGVLAGCRSECLPTEDLGCLR